MNRFARPFHLGAYLALLALQFKLHGAGFESPLRDLAISLLWSLPLLIPLARLFTGTHRPLIWGAYAALLYFSHGMMELLTAEGFYPLAIIEALLAVIVFVGTIWVVRSERTQG